MFAIKIMVICNIGEVSDINLTKAVNYTKVTEIISRLSSQQSKCTKKKVLHYRYLNVPTKVNMQKYIR